MPKYIPPASAVPLWATSPTTYPTSANPWSGGAVRINPGASVLAAGVTPGDQPPAQVFNYQLGASGDALSAVVSVASHNPLRRWQYTVTATGSGATWSQVVGVQPSRSYDTNGERQRMPLLLGPSGGSRLAVALSSDGTVVEVPRTINPGTSFSATCAVAGKPGEVLVGATLSTSIQYSIDYSNSFTVVNRGIATAALHFQSSNNTYFILGVDGNLYSGTSVAALTTGLTLSGVVAADSTISEFADDGGSNIVLVSRVNSNTTASIYRSGDSGATWSLSTTLAGRYANVAYSSTFGLFFTWDDSGAFKSSTNGVSWSPVSSGYSSDGFVSGAKTLACVGPAIVKLWKFVPSSTFAQRGIAYSVDGGVTWNTYAFGDVLTSGGVGGDLAQIRVINNRLFAVDNAGVWSSGPLGSPAQEF